MIASAPCPVCNGERWREHRSAALILALPASHRILCCVGCRTSKLDPPLSAADTAALYGAAYFSLSGAQSDPHVDDFHHTSTMRLPKFRSVIGDLRSLLPNGRTILDVGAATGDFVSTARAAGLDAVGVERSRAAVDAARTRGITLLHGDLATVVGHYDFVHLNHVFEHFAEPRMELDRIKTHMRAGAILYLEVPYQFNLVERTRARISRRRFRCSMHSFHHPYMYTPRSLRHLLESSGFVVLLDRVFDPRRYPAVGAVARLKRVAWSCLAGAGVGNYVEIFARLCESSRGPRAASKAEGCDG